MIQYDFYELLEDLTFEEVIEAYVDCRQNKRRKSSAVEYDFNFESNLYSLWQDIIHRRYNILPSLVFLVEKPVVREIFAADFNDRIVHHLLVRKINGLFENYFSDSSYSCRTGRGTLAAQKAVTQMIIDASDNYAKPCFVLKLDILGYFFHIDKTILKQQLKTFLAQHYHKRDKATVFYLLNTILDNNPIKNCKKKISAVSLQKLPQSKSLFHSRENCGLPIGNLTSQIFANFYLTEFDHYVNNLSPDLKYARYVDDMVLIHPDRAFLLEIKDKIKSYLYNNLHLDRFTVKWNNFCAGFWFLDLAF